MKAQDHDETLPPAVDSAREMLGNQGGGELTVKGVDGLIRSKDTIAPGNNPNPPVDREPLGPSCAARVPSVPERILVVPSRTQEGGRRSALIDLVQVEVRVGGPTTFFAEEP